MTPHLGLGPVTGYEPVALLNILIVLVVVAMIPWKRRRPPGSFL